MQAIMEKQLSIFDIPIMKVAKKGIIAELNELSSQFLIDSHYKKITFGRTFKRFPEYIDKVYEILKKYYDELKEFEDIIGSEIIGIAKRENCIRIYQPRCQYCIWCISMIDNEFYQYARGEHE